MAAVSLAKKVMMADLRMQLESTLETVTQLRENILLVRGFYAAALQRAETAEAKLAEIKAQETIAWAHYDTKFGRGFWRIHNASNFHRTCEELIIRPKDI